MILGKTFAQLLKIRTLIGTSKYSFADNGKSQIQIPASTSIVDPLYFERKSTIARLINWHKTNNAFTDCTRSFPGFSRQTFEQKYLNQYNSFVEKYHKRQVSDVEPYITDQLFKQYKFAAKNKSKDLPFGPLKEATSMKVVQGRINSNQITPFRSADRWFQFTCKFQSEGEESYYHIIQRHYKGKNFKILKFFIA